MGAAAQTCSTGADGPLVVSGSLVLALPPDGVFNFTTILVQPGASLRFTRNAENTAVYLFATGAVDIRGTIQISAIGATGGPGGGDGGVAGNGAQSGADGSGPSPGVGGPMGTPNPGNAAGGGGMATAGLTAIRHTGPSPAPGGGAIPVPDPLRGGSGGGGGGGWVFFGVPLGGGNGGSAGGGLHICSDSTITVSGSILANGVDGGYGFANIGGHGGPGGGGSGGVLDLSAAGVAVQPSGRIEAKGGRGGGLSTIPIWDPNFSSGADGGRGYLRVNAPVFTNDGTLDAVLIVVCAIEVDSDGDVDLNDLTILLSHFGVTSGATRADGDLDDDDDVDLGDLTTLLSVFGTAC
jgi:hypothetical protein